MDLSQELLQKIPSELHAHEHFKPLTETVELQHIASKEQLLAFIDNEIVQVNLWLKQNSSTGVQMLKQITLSVARLERYNTWKEWCQFL